MSIKKAYEIVVLKEDLDTQGEPVRARLDQYPQMLYTQQNLEELSASPCIKGSFKEAVEQALIEVCAYKSQMGDGALNADRDGAQGQDVDPPMPSAP